MKICYVKRNFRPESLKLIQKANEMLAALHAEGYDVTLRQLYYQLVAADLIPNTPTSYDNLGNIVNDARLAGLISWHAIIDRTRNLRRNSHWLSPGEAVQSVHDQYQIDKWEGQKYRPEVWVEKDALVGIVEQACTPLDVPYFSCRGYTSQSEMWSAAMRLNNWMDHAEQIPVIIHLGDHDPSGIDMTRDIEDRLKLFCKTEIEVRRIALNMPQIKRYRPPPNPAKLTDCRASAYVKIHGPNSWELDALTPRVITALITAEIQDVMDANVFEERKALEAKHKTILQKTAKALK